MTKYLIQTQVRFFWLAGSKHICSYGCDFVIIDTTVLVRLA